jgi:hypothetical protein
VHLSQGTDEYKNPVEFFRRTFLTESLKGMRVCWYERVEWALAGVHRLRPSVRPARPPRRMTKPQNILSKIDGSIDNSKHGH